MDYHPASAVVSDAKATRRPAASNRQHGNSLLRQPLAPDLTPFESRFDVESAIPYPEGDYADAHALALEVIALDRHVADALDAIEGDPAECYRMFALCWAVTDNRMEALRFSGLWPSASRKSARDRALYVSRRPGVLRACWAIRRARQWRVMVTGDLLVERLRDALDMALGRQAARRSHFAKDGSHQTADRHFEADLKAVPKIVEQLALFAGITDGSGRLAGADVSHGVEVAWQLDSRPPARPDARPDAPSHGGEPGPPTPPK